jgi:hypothetical protein
MKIYFCCFILSIIFLLVGTSIAKACFCAPYSFNEQIENSAVIFTGKVISVEKSGNKAKVVFNVKEKWKGVTSTQVEVFTRTDLDTCGYYFKIGKSYLVYTSSNDDSGKLSVSSCSRTRPKENKQSRKDLTLLRKKLITSGV